MEQLPQVCLRPDRWLHVALFPHPSRCGSRQARKSFDSTKG